MQHATTPNLAHLHMHIRHGQIQRLTPLVRRKGRDVRLGEALELILTAGFAWDDNDLLDLALTDREAPNLRLLGPVNRHGRAALTPAALRR